MPESSAPYKVLATKYRPIDFDGLVGQDVLVRTLTNAIEEKRIPNAFVLTGIRGVGKTTTARIIARALNCIGKDGHGEATIKPCGECSNCTSIIEDRHPDVIEMDAASRTGVDDVREVIENTHYMPISARYKIYIIDEVHMLSKNAFNALLKTLEEPPSHVKFIFATTEIRKIPVTVLSRCMRFDLKRITVAKLVEHLGNIAANENIQANKEALAIIAASSEGSVRDSLSLLDQVIANTNADINPDAVRQLLGISDKSKIIELFDVLAKGNIEAAFGIFSHLYEDGADPILILNDLLEFTYLVTRINAAPDIELGAQVPEQEKKAALDFANKLDVPYLTRLWQVLLKGLEEVKIAANDFAASEMILVRIVYMSSLPSPAKIIQQVNNGDSGGLDVKTENQNIVNIKEEPKKEFIEDFVQMVQLFKDKGEILLYNWLAGDVRPVKFEQGRIEVSVCDSVPADFSNKIADNLKNWTGIGWVVVISKEQGEATLHEIEQEKENKKIEDIKADPEVNKVLEMFPGATVEKIES